MIFFTPRKGGFFYTYNMLCYNSTTLIKGKLTWERKKENLLVQNMLKKLLL